MKVGSSGGGRSDTGSDKITHTGKYAKNTSDKQFETVKHYPDDLVQVLLLES